jgi:hypothetical protein
MNTEPLAQSAREEAHVAEAMDKKQAIFFEHNEDTKDETVETPVPVDEVEEKETEEEEQEELEIPAFIRKKMN